MCVRLRERAVALWQTEQLITSHITTASSSASSGIESYTEALVGVCSTITYICMSTVQLKLIGAYINA